MAISNRYLSAVTYFGEPPFFQTLKHDMDQASPLLAAREGPAPPWQIPLLVHAFCCVLGFALCLPCGAILARYMRTVRPWWYTGHWIIQLGAALFIVPGVALGYLANKELGGTPWDNHKRTGTVLFVFYIVQCVVGAVIHVFKPPKDSKLRPIQNYFHAILGLITIALGMYQIHTGYNEEWPRYMYRGEDDPVRRLPKYVNDIWIVWCILLVVIYGAGMLFIRRQYAQEAAERLRSGHIILGALEPQRQEDSITLAHSESVYSEQEHPGKK